jgi:hypothetical protein
MQHPEPTDWQELTRLTDGAAFVVERVRLVGKEIAIEGAFTPPQLARLTGDDQVFVAAFLRRHGAIKEMEQMFGVSYPTIKARLNRIAGSLDFIDESPAPARSQVLAEVRAEVLDRLARGEITAEDAIAALEESK